MPGLYRGFLTYPKLQVRWHDVGKRNTRLIAYGLAIWKPSAKDFDADDMQNARPIP
jgi:hypothetical protein